MKLVHTAYPNANMTVRDGWKTFPPMYIIYSGEMHKYKKEPPQLNGFNMGIGDSPLEAWSRAWDTVNEMMMEKLRQ